MEQPPASHSDRQSEGTSTHVVLVVVYTLGVIAFVAALGVIFLASRKIPSSDVKDIALVTISFVGGVLVNPKSLSSGSKAQPEKPPIDGDGLPPKP